MDIEKIPGEFRERVSGRGSVVSLANLGLMSVPAWVGELVGLQILDLSGNKLKSLPAWLGSLVGLTRLELRDNQLAGVPQELGNLVHLTFLGLAGNNLRFLPDSLRNLRGLKILDLANNDLRSVPECLEGLAGLEALGLGGNLLEVLPCWLGNLNKLEALYVHANRLERLPDGIGNLASLDEFDLHGNRLVELPESLGNLTSLGGLFLDDNRLAGLPAVLGSLGRLSVISLGGNPLRSPLREIAEDGTDAVKAYLRLVVEGTISIWDSKLLVVGEGGVGKTSVIRALAGERHDPREPSTHGVRTRQIKLPHSSMPGMGLPLSAWDFGGQDIYHATHQFFLSDRSLFLLLWNARLGWEQGKIPYWLEIIKARAPESPVILVATHTEGRPVDLPLKELGASFPQIAGSVSVDNETRDGIGELARIMAEKAAGLPLMGSPWPVDWAYGLMRISEQQAKYGALPELRRMLAAEGTTDPAHQKYVLRALHALGKILYFDQDEELSDIVILHPEWVNDYIARVLDSAEVDRRDGVLTRPHERELWDDLDPGLRTMFLQMMEKFDLSYQIRDDPYARSLVVERLPWGSPAYEDRWDEALRADGAREIRLDYELATMPPGIPTWFIAREHRFTTRTHWRSGALLQAAEDPRVLGLIKADRQNKRVELAVRGPVPSYFFSILRDGFESTLKRYQGLGVMRLVPCTCRYGDGTQPGMPCEHKFQYEALQRRAEARKRTIECELSMADVSVSDLLFAIGPVSTDEILSRVSRLDRRLDAVADDVRELRYEHREFLKALRRQQARVEAECPGIFTLAPLTGRGWRPGVQRLRLSLCCEEPGAFHTVGEPYVIDQPERWLKAVGPYLVTLVGILKHTTPLAGPVLGIVSAHLDSALSSEMDLMCELVNQIPDDLVTERAEIPGGQLAGRGRRITGDADYRALHALLRELDPHERWGGLGRVYTPEDQVLWLCDDHARQYGPRARRLPGGGG